jgi:RND family efflux transporter MFP subunit
MRSELLAFVLAIAACSKASAPEAESEQRAAADVSCKPAASQDVEQSVEVSGVIAPPPRLDATVTSPVAGRIAKVAVEEGDHVAAGALLAIIEDPSLPAGSIEAHAGVAGAQANKLAADQEVARQTRLVESGIGARRDLDDAKAKAAAAAAELEAAGARSNLASQKVARQELRAPHAGVVLHLFRRTGESVDGTTATPVAEVADLSVLEVRAQVPPAVLVKLQDDLAAHVRVLGTDAEVPGTVERVAPAVDPTTLLGSVRVTLGPTPKPPPVGTAATARIVISHRPGVVVPPTALRRSAVGSDEVVVCEGGVAKVRTVTIGQRGDAVVEITSGLKAGEQIVVDHVLGLDDGQALGGSGAGPKAEKPKGSGAEP